MTPAMRMDDTSDDGRQPRLRVLAGGATRASGTPGAGRLDDEALVAAFLVGDDDAFAELVRRNEPLVLALVRRYARTPEDARDLAQRTFLRAFEAARRALRRGQRNAVPFRRWLVRVAVNLAKNHLRDEGRFARVPLEALRAPGAEPVADGPGFPGADVRLAEAERAASVRRAVLRLPRRQREVLTLRIDAELPFAEIAEALGVTENAAKVSFHHATKRLRELVSGEGRP